MSHVDKTVRNAWVPKKEDDLERLDNRVVQKTINIKLDRKTIPENKYYSLIMKVNVGKKEFLK